jgi:hypothetical protein
MTTGGSFYSTNTLREYPFVETSTISDDFNFPDKCIVDFQCQMFGDHRYNLATDSVYLYSAVVTDGVACLTFLTTSEGLENWAIKFYRSETDDEYTTDFEQAVFIGGGDPPELPIRFEGYLTTGDIAALFAFCETHENLFTNEIAGKLVVLPSNVRVFGGESKATGPFVHSFRLANSNRSRWNPPTGCGDIVPWASGKTLYPGVFFDGNIKFTEGFNCLIREDEAGRSIIFGAGIGLGMGQPDVDIKLFPDEQLGDGSIFYSGGPACSEIIQSINGVSSEIIQLAESPGVRITSSVQDHTVYVDFDISAVGLCEPYIWPPLPSPPPPPGGPPPPPGGPYPPYPPGDCPCAQQWESVSCGCDELASVGCLCSSWGPSTSGVITVPASICGQLIDVDIPVGIAGSCSLVGNTSFWCAGSSSGCSVTAMLIPYLDEDDETKFKLIVIFSDPDCSRTQTKVCEWLDVSVSCSGTMISEYESGEIIAISVNN